MCAHGCLPPAIQKVSEGVNIMMCRYFGLKNNVFVCVALERKCYPFQKKLIVNAMRVKIIVTMTSFCRP